jgi:hypothetical protein
MPPIESIVCPIAIDFLERPSAALRAFRFALEPGRPLLISFRNRDAYWPFYQFRDVLPKPPGSPWPLGDVVQHASPLPRHDQPFEQCNDLSEARAC